MRLEEAANALNSPFVCFDVHSRQLLRFNQRLIDCLDYSPRELRAMPLDLLLPPEDRAAFEAAIRGLGSSLESGGVWRLRQKAGGWQVSELRWQRLQAGEINTVVAILLDVPGQSAGSNDQETGEKPSWSEAKLHMARRLLDMGLWELEIQSGRMAWSRGERLSDSARARDFAGHFDDYLALVHPEDRAGMIANYESARASQKLHFEFRHRVLGGDGNFVHVRGVAERERRGRSDWLVGVFQNITNEVEAQERLLEATRMQRIASQIARIGSWRVDLTHERLLWSPETAAIHEEAEGTAPSIRQAINYYAPEHRARISEVFNACAQVGRSFDEILQIITAKGNRVWVRCVGEAVRNQTGSIVAVEGAFQDISELVSARDETEVLSRRLRQTLDSISDGFLMLDQEWRFLFMNSQAERMVAHSREELLGECIWKVFPEALGTAVQREFERAVESGKPARFRNFYPPLEAWFEVDAEPTPEGLAVYFRDVTLEQDREERLRLLETAVSRQGDMLMITEAETANALGGPKIVYVNEAFVKRTGFSVEEAVGATPRILQGLKTDRAELDRIRQALEEWRPVRAELINYTKSGEEYWVELDIAPIADREGRYTHWVSVERDVTERKSAEEELVLNQERFRLVTRAASDVIYDWDIITDTHWWNDNLRMLLGHDPEQIEPGLMSWQNLLHPDDRERVTKSIDALISGPDAFWSGEYRFRHADGHYLTMIDRTFVIRNSEGTAIRMLGSLVDVSSRREMESRLQQAQKLEAVGQLTGGLAHDFNNLLTVILGNSEILAESLSDQEQLHRLAEMISSAAERGAELTRRLLAFSRKQALQPQVLDVGDLVKGMESLLVRTLPESIDIRIVCAANLWQAEIDPSQLESAILNLVLNARDAMPNGGRLTIEMANIVLIVTEN